MQKQVINLRNKGFRNKKAVSELTLPMEIGGVMYADNSGSR